MNDRSYTKLFSSIVTSSLWSEDSDTRVVWVTMLALANAHGEVFAAIPGLARAANVSLDACRGAIGKFEGPDRDSRTPDHEGRRIERISGGWRLLNYEHYRQMMSQADRSAYQREYIAKYRAEGRDASRPVVNSGKHPVNNGKQMLGRLGQAEAEAEAEVHTPPVPPKIPNKRVPPDLNGILTLKSAVGALYNRPESEAWSYEEETLLAQVFKRGDWQSDLEVIRRYKRAVEPRFFPQTVARLLADWNGALDKARTQVKTNARPKHAPTQQQVRDYIDQKFPECQDRSAGWAMSFCRYWDGRNWLKHDKAFDWQDELSRQCARWRDAK